MAEFAPMPTNSAFDDEDLALSINPSHTRRNSARSPGEERENYPLDSGSSAPQQQQEQQHKRQQQQQQQHTHHQHHHHHHHQQQQQQQPGASRTPVPPAATVAHKGVAPSNNVPQHPTQTQASAIPRTGKVAPPAKANKTRLGQYDLIRTLGEGSFGKVKLAVHQVSGQQVALKVISRRKLMAREMQGRIEREISYLQLLRHPHIIKLYTVITTSTEIIMVLEYAGSELFNYIVEHGRMPEDKARKFIQQIVCAVEYCHRHKIVHRDLKPENLLLDEHLNVKIADFGLSNIMTDGNFLKTSCGSPNYAAPEVISGKLYAGPEVDVWSCGVILYVLLVGRLPFDDEYIPALFKKIAQGNYHMPNYVPAGAQRLIKRMLQTSPITRITVQQIREDPWFTTNLPDYLSPQMDDYLDIGINPSKPIVPQNIAPNKPANVAEKMHNEVVTKLGKTLGYGQEDVKNALANEEPNAIKDAYLIVRENQLMRETPSLAKEAKLQPFLAQSPPVLGMSPIAQMTHLARDDKQQQQQQQRGSPLALDSGVANAARENFEADIIGANHPSRTALSELSPRVSTIRVLPTSLPHLWRAYMEENYFRPQREAAQRAQGVFDPLTNSRPDDDDGIRNLNPHANFARPPAEDAEGSATTPKETKKAKTTRWQFGIRSRNNRFEAMLAIYKALLAMGADWEPNTPFRRPPGADVHDYDDDSGIDSTDDEEEDDDDDDDDDDVDGKERDHDEGYQHEHASSNNTVRDSSHARTQSRSSLGSHGGSGSSSTGRRRRRYGPWNDWGYEVPEDPYIIKARFLKRGMYAPENYRPNNSAQTSLTDLQDARSGNVGTKSGEQQDREGAASSSSSPSSSNKDRRGSTLSHSGSATKVGSNTSKSVGESGSRNELSRNVNAIALAEELSAENPMADDSVYVYMTIQLYQIEREFYVVDFKSAGYERVVRIYVNAESDTGGNRLDLSKFARHGKEHPPRGLPPNRLNANGYSYYGAEEYRENNDGDDDDDDEDDEEDGRSSSGDDDGAESGSGDRERSTGARRRKWKARTGETYFGEGRATEEKEVSSPFPFLDVASRLIIQLAEAD